MIELTKDINGRIIKLRCIPAGSDFQVIITGGREHIGAAALGQCYGEKSEKANASVIAACGHREDELALKTARFLSRSLKASAAVTAGIHFDNLSAHEIEEITAAVQELSEELVRKVLNT
jgi:hypothetical protein